MATLAYRRFTPRYAACALHAFSSTQSNAPNRRQSEAIENAEHLPGVTGKGLGCPPGTTRQTDGARLLRQHCAIEALRQHCATEALHSLCGALYVPFRRIPPAAMRKPFDLIFYFPSEPERPSAFPFASSMVNTTSAQSGRPRTRTALASATACVPSQS